MVIIMHPSLETYEKLYAEYSTSIQCPCANLSIPYEAFLNVTFVLHQVCSSDLVSSNWLNYLLLFDPNHVPIWTETGFSRDFRSIGLWYFQLLATFCSLAQANIADGQRIFKNSLFIENNLLPKSLFIQETKTLANAFINKTRNIYARILKWVDIAGIINRFLTATNVNYQITVTNDNQVNINDVQIIGKASITHTSVGSNDPCSCARDIHECVLRPILYTNGSSVFDFVQVFYEIRIGCMPSIGFSMSEIVWWYNKTYMENIRATYAIVINNSQLSPQLESLDSSLPTRFHDNYLTVLLDAMFIEESFISNQRYDLFFEQCVPISCSYTMVRRRNILFAILLLVSVCSGLNRGLRLSVPLISKSVLLCRRKWKNRNSIHGK
ncbi:unnamed protein product [Rotaria sp. Silwood2]|nr:unnamed protein product [Rotaria sp. Silwood2]CAF2848002.1 unnamed protein product [Rotaria sp. Silwood2]CAF3234385.1 unnamed protein product [Rotaria sp. Silwood2]